MKVYLVYWSNNEEDMVTKVYKSHKKAKEYVDYQNKVSDDSYFLEEMEVEE
jgi:hypothetical protein